MKDIKRLATGAVLSNGADGLLTMLFVPYAGGDYGLIPKQTEDGLILVDPNRPQAFGVRIAGDADSLKKIANALNAVARSLEGTGGDTDNPDDTPFREE